MDSKVIVGIIAFCGVLLSAGLSAAVTLVIARITARNTVRSELTKRQTELAKNIRTGFSRKSRPTTSRNETLCGGHCQSGRAREP